MDYAHRAVWSAIGVLVLAAALPFASAHAAYYSKTVAVSALPAGGTASGASRLVSMSSDGRFVAFQSDAPDLAPSSPFTDVFVRDTITGETLCVSRGMAGSFADGPSTSPAISADGRWIAFESAASNIVSSDTNGAHDVFVHDRVAGTTRLVSASVSGTPASADSYAPSIDDDGSRIAFVSAADDLVGGDAAKLDDVFVRDMQTGQIVRVSAGLAGEADGDSMSPSISGDGSKVAFVSHATNIVVGDTNSQPDVFVSGFSPTGATRVSVSASGAQVSLGSYVPSIDRTGLRIAFESLSSALVVGDTNGVRDVFVRDVRDGTTTRVSTGSTASQADGESKQPRISPDGSRVAFTSAATNLSGVDTNGVSDIFVKVIDTGVIGRVSGSFGGGASNGASMDPALCDVEDWVAFASEGSNVVSGDVNASSDVFMSRCGARTYDRVAGPDRYTTAVQASRRAFPSGAAVAVIATGRNWPDALGGSALAGAVGGPLLLTDSAALSAATRDELRRLRVTSVYVLGGTASISTRAEKDLAAIVGAAKVRRLGGANRYSTGTAIADEVLRLKGAGYGGTALVCTGGNFPDALAGSPMAARAGMPVVLVNPANRAFTLPAGTRRAVILGGSASVPTSVEQQLKARLGTASVMRLGGSNRYDASANIARWGITDCGLAKDDISVATGEKFADALSGGVMAGRMNGVILLCQRGQLPASPAAFLSGNASSIERVRIVGGEMSVGPTAVGAMKRSLGD